MIQSCRHFIILGSVVRRTKCLIPFADTRTPSIHQSYIHIYVISSARFILPPWLQPPNDMVNYTRKYVTGTNCTRFRSQLRCNRSPVVVYNLLFSFAVLRNDCIPAANILMNTAAAAAAWLCIAAVVAG